MCKVEVFGHLELAKKKIHTAREKIQSAVKNLEHIKGDEDIGIVIDSLKTDLIYTASHIDNLLQMLRDKE